MRRPLLTVLLLTLALVAAACASEDDAADTDPAAEDAAAEPADDDAAEPAADDAAGGGEYSAEVTLTGDAELPGPGAEGTGTATFTIEGTEACLEGEVTDVGAVMAGHIHTGTAEESGDVLLDLAVTTEADGPVSTCVEVDEATATASTSDPAGHYVNLHTAEFPDGAIRAQLT